MDLLFALRQILPFHNCRGSIRSRDLVSKSGFIRFIPGAICCQYDFSFPSSEGNSSDCDTFILDLQFCEYHIRISENSGSISGLPLGCRDVIALRLSLLTIFYNYIIRTF